MGSSDDQNRGRHAATDDSTARRRKPEEMLSSVISETTVSAAVELLRKNPEFALPNDTAWVTLLLAADKIGGLSLRDKRDEAKGSIIELISADKIATVATAEMLDNDVFAIIPDPSTLEEMSEYSLLTEADYVWAVLTRDDQDNLQVDIIETDSPGNFLQAQAVSNGQLSLQELVGDAIWAHNAGVPAAGAATPAEEPVNASEEVAHDFDPGFAPDLDAPSAFTDDDIAAAFDDEIGGVDPGSNEEIHSAPDDLDEAAFADEGEFDDSDVDVDGPDDSEDDESVQLAFDDGSGDPADGASIADSAPASEALVSVEDATGLGEDPASAESEPVVIDSATVRDAVARRYADDGFELRVDLDEFAATFLESSAVTTIDVPADVSGWLGEQVAAATAQANAELAQLSAQHDASLQTLYVQMMSQTIEEVLKRNALDNEGSRFSKALQVVAQEYERNLAGLDETVRQQQQSIRDAFDAEVEAEATKAASEARARVRARRGPRLDRELAEINSVVTSSVEERHEAARAKVLDQRRRDVRQYVQMGQTQVFDVVKEQQEKFLEAERELMKQWTTSIAGIIDENRKHEIARISTQAEQLAHDDQVDRLRREQESALAQLRAEHQTRVAALQTQIETDQVASQEQLQRVEDSWKHQLELERVATSNESARIAELRDQLAYADQAHKSRIVELEAERAASADELTKVTSVHANMTRAVLVLMVVLALLMAVVGGIIGYTMH